MSDQESRFYEFCDFRLDSLKNLLFRNGTLVPLTQKAFQTLLILVQNSGEVVNKDELIARIWPDTVVEENNLAQRISQVRKALGETSKDHDYIVTVPGQGYCFVATAKKIGAETKRTVSDSDVDETRVVSNP